MLAVSRKTDDPISGPQKNFEAELGFKQLNLAADPGLRRV
jgi:hypothetical protein